MEKNIYRYEVGIVVRVANDREGYIGNFKDVEQAMAYADEYKAKENWFGDGDKAVKIEEYIAVEEYIEYDDGEEICNRFPVEYEDAEPYIESVITYCCEDEDAPYLWRIEYKSGNVSDIWRMLSYPCDDVIGFMKSAASHVTHNVLNHEYETVYRAS